MMKKASKIVKDAFRGPHLSIEESKDVIGVRSMWCLKEYNGNSIRHNKWPRTK